MEKSTPPPIHIQISEKIQEIEVARQAIETLEIGVDETLLLGPNECETLTVKESLATRIESTRKQISKQRNQLGLAQKRFLALQADLHRLIEKQTAGLQKTRDSFSAKLQSIQDTLDAANLYLGRDESYYLIRKGEPAPANEPISIRQRIVFMDEETALEGKLAQEGGITFETVQAFDKWIIKDPKNLEQVFPELKGIIGVRIRHHERENHGMSPMEAAQAAALDQTGFLLLRNGENLYRLDNNCPALMENLFPTKEEFEELYRDPFYREGLDNEEYLRPGTKGFSHAMARAKGLQIHYLKIALSIQGILDRTRIFHPLPEHLQMEGAAGNIFAASAGVETSNIKMIRDSEGNLPTGKPDFHDWLRERNKNVTDGSRLILSPEAINKDNYQNRSWKSVDRFISFNSDIDYLAEAIPDEPTKFAIRFYEGGWYGNHRRTRSKAHLYKSCLTYLNLDDPKGTLEEEIQFYLHDRKERVNYKTSIPLLLRALNLIQTEKEQEKPFLQLIVNFLQGHFKKTFPKKGEPNVEKLEAIAHSAAAWFKRKKKIQRALLTVQTTAGHQAEEKDSFLAVLKQATQLLDNDTRAEGKPERDKSVQDTVLTTRPKTIFIGHKEGSIYVSLEPETPEEWIPQPGYLKETLWSYNKGEPKVIEEIRWKIKKPRHLKLRKLFSTPAWEEMPDNIQDHELLTEENIEELRQVTKKLAESYKAKGCTFFAVTLEVAPKKQYVRFYGFGPRFTHANESIKELTLFSQAWKKTAKGIEIPDYYRCKSFYSTHWKGENHWHSKFVDVGLPMSGSTKAEKILWMDEKDADIVQKAHNENKALETQNSEEREASIRYWNLFAKGLKPTILAREKKKYIEEDEGIEELWPEHLKTIIHSLENIWENYWGPWRYGINALLENNLLPVIPEETRETITPEEIARLNTENNTDWTVPEEEKYLLALPWILPEVPKKENENEDDDEDTEE